MAELKVEVDKTSYLSDSSIKARIAAYEQMRRHAAEEEVRCIGQTYHYM